MSSPPPSSTTSSSSSSNSSSSNSSSSNGKTSSIVPRSKYKLVFLGDEAVGKTSIITRFMYDTFDTTYKVTIGIDFWIDDVRNERGSDVVIMLVGNKTDLNEKRQVTAEEAEQFARDKQIQYIETSAKAGVNVKGLFRKLALSLPGLDTTGKQFGSAPIPVSIKPTAENVEKQQEKKSGCICWR